MGDIMAGVDKFVFAEYLHDPHSTLDMDDPDSEVYVVASAFVLVSDDPMDMPTITLTNIKVFPDLDSSEFDLPSREQLDFWDLEYRICEQFLWSEQACSNCGCKLRHHLEIEADVLKCVEKGCDCVGDKVDLEP